MSESLYRLCMAILFAVLVCGVLWLGWEFTRIGRQMAENGRYVQVDIRKDNLILGAGGSSTGGGTRAFDTRTGVPR
jgi:hypothetical protein